jgi:hypothetical protein
LFIGSTTALESHLKYPLYSFIKYFSLQKLPIFLQKIRKPHGGGALRN